MFSDTDIARMPFPFTVFVEEISWLKGRDLGFAIGREVQD
jgi:hypothetical protein